MSTPVGSTVAMSRRCGQLTLFDCVAAGGSESTAKRQKIDTADAAGNAESNSSRATDNDQFETHLGVDPAGTDSLECAEASTNLCPSIFGILATPLHPKGTLL